MPQLIRQAKHLLSRTWKVWNTLNVPRIGAALAYYTTFSMAPVLIIAIVLAGTVFGEDAARGEVSHQLQGLLGVTGAKAVEEMITSAHRGGSGVIATIIGIVTLLVGATRAFGELQSALDLIWGVPSPVKTHIGTMLRERLLTFVMILLVGLFLLASLLVSAGLSGIQSSFGGLASPFIAQSLNIVISLIVTTSLFALVYKVLPTANIAWKDVAVGGFVTAILFTIGKQIIGIYLGNSALASTYGAAGSFAVMLVWIYYTAQVVLLGAIFTEVFTHRHTLDLKEAGHHSDAANQPHKDPRDATP